MCFPLHAFQKVREKLRYGLMMKVPAGFAGTVRYDGGPFRVVVVDGTIIHDTEHAPQRVALEAGSYLGSAAEGPGETSFSSSSGAMLYIRARSPLALTAD